jgi:hypothetical protein
VISHHNEIRDELVHMVGRAMTPSVICDKPLICPGCVAVSVKTPPSMCTANPSSENEATGKDDRGDLLLQGFWARGTDCIVDVHVTDTDAKSYVKRALAKVLETQEKEKNVSISSPVLRTDNISPILCALWMACSVAKQRHLLSALQPNWPQNGSDHTHRRVGTSLLV